MTKGRISSIDGETLFYLGENIVDGARNLVKGPSGEATLEPRVMALLLMLAKNATQVVCREDLIAEVWNTEFGGDESLTRAISILRRVLGDTHGRRHFIETIPKRGYRLIVAPSQTIPEKANTGPQTVCLRSIIDKTRKKFHASYWVAFLALLVVGFVSYNQFWIEQQPAQTNEGHSWIAITNPVSTNLENENQVFADGLRRAIARKFLLAGVETVSHRETAAAEFLLKSEISLSSDAWLARLRIEEQETGIGLWSGEFHQTYQREAQFQENVANAVATMMRCVKRRRSKSPVSRQYLRLLTSACAIEERWRPEFRLTATKIAELGPKEANAFALQALAYAIPVIFSRETETKRAAYAAKATKAAYQALSLDPENAEALTAQALIDISNGMIVDAEHKLRRANQSDPIYPLSRHYLHSLVLFHTGQVDQARLVNMESVALDPLNNYEQSHRAFYDIIQMTERGFTATQALNTLKYIAANGDHSLARALKIQYEMFYGDPEQARLLIESETQGFAASDENLNCAKLIITAREAGNKPNSDEILSTCNPNSFVFYPPRLLALSGDVDMLYDSFHRMTNKTPIVYAEVWTPEWAEFRADPRFMDFAARNGLAQYWLETGNWPDFCATQNDLQYDCKRSARQAVDRLD